MGSKLNKTKMTNNKFFNKILTAILIAAIGFIFLNLVFMLDGAVSALINLFIKIDGPEHLTAIISSQILFIVIVAIISYFILRSRWVVWLKASYIMVPAAAIYVILGASLYRWPLIAYSICALFGLAGLFVLYRTKQPWQYWFAFCSISIVLLIGTLMGMEI